MSSLSNKLTKSTYRADLRAFAGYWLEQGVQFESVTDLQLGHFVAWRDHMIDGLGHAPATVNRKMAALKSMMTFALSMGLITHNLLAVLKLPRPDPIRPTAVFDEKQVVRILALVQRDRPCARLHRAILTTLFYTGVRRAELVSLKVGDIYEERHHKVMRVRGKGGKVRVIPLHPVVQEAINSYLAKSGRVLDPDEPLFMAAKRWRSRKYATMAAGTVYQLVRKYVAKAGLGRGHPHACRATVISHLIINERASIDAVQELAGHASVVSTQRYLKRSRGLDRSAAYSVSYG